MSAFLGPIHIWLFEKIKFQENLNKHLIEMAAVKGYNKEKLAEVDSVCGVLEEGELADLIDGMNIHGWLQERISIVERRLAYITKSIIEEDQTHFADILKVAKAIGEEKKPKGLITAKEGYTLLEDLLVSGMPCDRVNMVVADDGDSLTWEQTIDIHKQYWDQFDIDVKYYYEIRNAIIEGIFDGSDLSYEKEPANQFTLRKR
jgi:hypothetical protein